jgi:hypothetical protein
MSKRLLERHRRRESSRPHIKFDEDINEMAKVRAKLLLKHGPAWVFEYWKRFTLVYDPGIE